MSLRCPLILERIAPMKMRYLAIKIGLLCWKLKNETRKAENNGDINSWNLRKILRRDSEESIIAGRNFWGSRIYLAVHVGSRSRVTIEMQNAWNKMDDGGDGLYNEPSCQITPLFAPFLFSPSHFSLLNDPGCRKIDKRPCLFISYVQLSTRYAI